jgi:hypothetical protein
MILRTVPTSNFYCGYVILLEVHLVACDQNNTAAAYSLVWNVGDTSADSRHT